MNEIALESAARKCGCGTDLRLRSNGFWAGKPRTKHYCPSCEKVRVQKYSRSMSDGRRAWDARNPQKKRAFKAVEVALARGAISREACSVCGRQPAAAHHPKFEDPLAVTWLCPNHRGEALRKARGRT